MYGESVGLILINVGRLNLRDFSTHPNFGPDGVVFEYHFQISNAVDGTDFAFTISDLDGVGQPSVISDADYFNGRGEVCFTEDSVIISYRNWPTSGPRNSAAMGRFFNVSCSPVTTAIPEPNGVLLFGLGGLVLAVSRGVRRRKKGH